MRGSKDTGKRSLTIQHGAVKRLTRELQSYHEEVEQLQRKLVQIQSNRELVTEAGEDVRGELKRYTEVLNDTRQMVPHTERRLKAAVAQLQETVRQVVVTTSSSNGQPDAQVNVGGSTTQPQFANGTVPGTTTPANEHKVADSGNGELDAQLSAIRTTLKDVCEMFPHVAAVEAPCEEREEASEDLV